MALRKQKIIGVTIAIFQFFAFIPSAFASNTAGAAGEAHKFLVTAYYSPVPDQTFYIRGSYEADIKLNGRGTNGADGTEVYVGMLAAPKTYPFGTRILLPGLGVGEVHDRGGAIIAGKNYDRIDVWMGRGEEGLARALNWGARLIEGEIYWNAEQVEPGLSYGWVSNELPADMLKRLAPCTLQNPEVFSKPITKASDADDIRELQTALTTFGYYDGPINGVYGPMTTDAVLMFQMAEGIIKNAGAQGAGNFGPMTRSVLKEKLETYNSAVIKERDRLEQNRLMLASGLGKNASGDDVNALQRMLWELGYYNGPLSGEYDSVTIDAVFEFQKSHGILDSQNDKGAGYYGKKTHEALSAAINEKIKQVAKYPMQLQTWVPAKIELPQIASLKAPEIALEKQGIKFDESIMNKKVVQSPVASDSLILTDIDVEDENEEVVKLQNILIKNGYLSAGMNTGYYGDKTRDAVLKFQLEKRIVKAETDTGAGRVGPKTRQALNLL